MMTANGNGAAMVGAPRWGRVARVMTGAAAWDRMGLSQNPFLNGR